MTGAGLALTAATLGLTGGLSLLAGRTLRSMPGTVQPAARRMLLWFIPAVALPLMLLLALLVSEGSERGLKGIGAMGGTFLLVHLFHLRLLRRIAAQCPPSPANQPSG